MWCSCRAFVPRLRELSHILSEKRSTLTGRVVDSYTNILTVKLFARPRDEDEFVQASVDEHTLAFRHQFARADPVRRDPHLDECQYVGGTGAIAIWLWSQHRIAVDAVAMTLPLVWQIVNISGWVAQNVTAFSRMSAWCRMACAPSPFPGRCPTGPMPCHLSSKAARCASRMCISAMALRAAFCRHRPVHRPRRAHRTGGSVRAGKSTLVNLLLRFFEVETGRILIDGQDIAHVTQDSLRGHIAVVTQDTSLLHRSIRDNVRYGRPEASEAEIREARRAPMRCLLSRLWKTGRAAAVSTPMPANAA